LATQKGKNLEGEITGIIERKKVNIVGTLHKSKSFYFVIPDEKEIHRDIYIAQKHLNGAKSNDKVVVYDIDWETSDLNPEGKILEVLGKSGTYDAEITAITRELNIPSSFPVDVIVETESIKDEIPPDEFSMREDLREEEVFTIDPENAKDFDDAVSLKKLRNGNFSLGIHIADVSYYVPKGSKIFQEAQKRGTSVYLIGKVIPMLPEKLSNNICSLLPGKDRLTYSVLVEITPRGKINSYKIVKSIINSQYRFSYNEVQQILDNKEGKYYNILFELNRIAKILRNRRIKKGSINFIKPEVDFILDESGNIVNTVLKKIKDSHELIEEYMLLANRIVASEINRNNKTSTIPFIYRIHDVPDKEKLKEFIEFIKSLGYSFNELVGNTSAQIRELLDQTRGKPEEGVINEVAIRTMAKAIYSVKNIGHYGLGFSNYTHFTSPIRRFPDLVVHEIIFSAFQKVSKNPYNLMELEKISEHSSKMERNAMEAERISVKIKQMEYLKKKIGKEFAGIISGVTNFGFFVELNDSLAEGLVHIKDLYDDYYVYDEKKYTLRGKSSGKKYRLGDPVIVKILDVNEEKKEINFALLSK
jgi:ribonuclease R